MATRPRYNSSSYYTGSSSNDIHYEPYDPDKAAFDVFNDKIQKTTELAASDKKTEDQYNAEKQEFMKKLTEVVNTFNSNMEEIKKPTRLIIITEDNWGQHTPIWSGTFEWKNDHIIGVDTQSLAYNNLVTAWNDFTKQIESTCSKYRVCIKDESRLKKKSDGSSTCLLL
jgi:hypothetical protein